MINIRLQFLIFNKHDRLVSLITTKKSLLDSELFIMCSAIEKIVLTTINL